MVPVPPARREGGHRVSKPNQPPEADPGDPMNKLKINKETLRTLNEEHSSEVAGAIILPTRRTCADFCTDSCVMTRRNFICCW